MKVKSFFAGALGLFLFFAGQSLPAQEGTLAAPNRKGSTLPAPERDSSTLADPGRETLPTPGRGDTLPGPERETSTLPAPGGGSKSLLPPGARDKKAEAVVSALPEPNALGGLFGQAAQNQLQTAAKAGQAAGQEVTEAAASGPVPGNPPSGGGVTAWSPPERGLFFGAMAGLRVPSYNTDGTDWEKVKWKNVKLEGESTFNGGLFLG
ncbi:MAG: hypothetical protein LBB77_10160, partial [Treponema sp.]|nr:hypothetical protein [Treponema sp.]